MSIKVLHLTAFPLRSKAAGELGRYATIALEQLTCAVHFVIQIT